MTQHLRMSDSPTSSLISPSSNFPTISPFKHFHQFPLTSSKMAEQEIYGSKLAGHNPSLSKGAFTGSGAEQDIYGSKFAGHTPSLPRGSFTGSGAEQDIYGNKFAGHSPSLPRASASGSPRFGSSGAEQDVYGSHFNRTPYQGLGTSALGLLHSTVLPSFSLHAGLSAVAYGISRYTNRVEGKDYLWASGMTLNAWWSAVGSRVVYDGLSVGDAWSSLSYSQKLLLAGVTAWGVRLTSRVVSRSLQRGKDDPRYETTTKDAGFWNQAFFNTFLPEAVAQTLIALPFTVPFRAVYESLSASPVTSYGSLFHGLAIFLFSTGFALETLADVQLESFKKNNTAESINREGVWSIVRHPK
jgi:steroid 5-alpha reductase family enzyme